MRTWRDDARISPNSHRNLEFQFDSVMTHSIALLNVFPQLGNQKRCGPKNNNASRLVVCISLSFTTCEAMDDGTIFLSIYLHICEKCNLYEYSNRWKIKLDAFDSPFFGFLRLLVSWNFSKVKSNRFNACAHIAVRVCALFPDTYVAFC